ncbi:MAG: hypothetical protein HFG33_02885 [Bacilli bacterium]|nr:hypothetical protein [Bacilli bacterium]
MRHATGAAWIFGICLTFIIMFTAYLVVSLNYAKAFRIKNRIVSYLEENEGYTSSLDERISEYLYNQGYNAYGQCENYIEVDGYDREWEMVATIDSDVPAGTNQHNACIYQYISNGTGEEDICAMRSRYRVVTFFKFDIPVVRYFSAFQVAGESRYIYDFANSPGC